MTHLVQKMIQIITDFSKKKMGADDSGITSFIC